MKKILYILLCVIPLSVLAADDTSKKKYPPYPEVWGYELPEPEKESRNGQPRPYRLKSGDIVFTYVHKWLVGVVDLKDRSISCDSKKQLAVLEFFSNKIYRQNCKERSKFTAKYRKYYLSALKAPKKIIFSDGTRVTLGSDGFGRCYSPYPYYIRLENADGEVIKKKTLLYRLGSPRTTELNPECGEESGTVIEYVDSSIFYLIDLFDKERETFLLYESKGNIILRLDKNLDTNYPVNKDRVFLVDTEIIDDIKAKADGFSGSKYQAINNSVFEYIKTMSRGK